jgi:hypothetical protein
MPSIRFLSPRTLGRKIRGIPSTAAGYLFMQRLAGQVLLSFLARLLKNFLEPS